MQTLSVLYNQIIKGLDNIENTMVTKDDVKKIIMEQQRTLLPY
jgi:hypothetical protein